MAACAFHLMSQELKEVRAGDQAFHVSNEGHEMSSSECILSAGDATGPRFTSRYRQMSTKRFGGAPPCLSQSLTERKAANLFAPLSAFYNRTSRFAMRMFVPLANSLQD